MVIAKCPVNESLLLIEKTLQGQDLQHPRSRRLLEEIYMLVSDIAMGRAGDQHLAGLNQRIDMLRESGQDGFTSIIKPNHSP